MNYSRQTKYNDIGLLEFEFKVTFNAYIKPACLYSMDLIVETKAVTTIVGKLKVSVIHIKVFQPLLNRMGIE